MPHRTFIWFILPTALAMILFIGLPIVSSFFQSLHIENEQVLMEVENCDPFGCTTNVRVDVEATEKIEAENKKQQDELAKIIDKSKTTCKTLGFEEGTEKFSDCTLKLYTQEIDNKVALEVAKQKSSSSSTNSGTMIIYDPVRDRQNKIDKGMEMITGGCTLGKDC